MQKATHSTKVSEKFSIEGDQLIIKNTFDGSQVLGDVQHAREVTKNSFASDYKHVGNVDFAMLGVWLKEAGVAWDDTPAVKDVIRGKLMSNEFSGLRVWQGSY